MKKIIPVLTLFAVVSGCGGGVPADSAANSTATPASAVASLQITPALGAFSSGTVKLMTVDGSIAATAPLVNGSVTLSARLGCVPAIIEVSNGTFFDEGLNQLTEMGGKPLRAALSCFSGQGRLAVTALTELAYRKLGAARDSAAIDSANEFVRLRYAPEVSSLLAVPTKVGSLNDAKNLGISNDAPAGMDIYATRLAALAVAAQARSISTMQFISEAGDNLAQGASIDASATGTGAIEPLSAAYLNGIDDFTSKVATHMSTFANQAIATANDPPVMQRVEFSRLMRLLIAVPRQSRFILTEDNPAYDLQVKGAYYLPCAQLTAVGDGMLAYQSCKGIMALPYASIITMTGNSTATNVPRSQMNGYRYAQRIAASLDYAQDTRKLHVDLAGINMNAYTGSSPGVSPTMWATAITSCKLIDLRQATFTLTQGSDVFTLSNVDLCAQDDWGTVSPDAPYLDLHFAIRGLGPDRQVFSNAASPLVFRRPGVLADMKNSTGPLLVGGKLTVPVAVDRLITIEPNDASGTTARITIETRSGGGSSIEVATLPVRKMLQKGIY